MVIVKTLFKCLISSVICVDVSHLFVFVGYFLLTYNKNCLINHRKKIVIVAVVWEATHSGWGTNRTGAEVLSFYYPTIVYCTDQMLEVMLLS